MNDTAVTVTPGYQDGCMPGRRPWNPWEALRNQPDVFFALARLPSSTGGAACAAWPDGEADIIIDSRVGRRRRNALLAHELVHLELGYGCIDPNTMPPTWRDKARRDENAVHNEVARRLVPLDDLAEFVAERSTLGDVAGHVWEAADHFDVPDEVALRALKLLEEAWADGG